ncbi:MAG: carboxypeptidase regulatory-like domain-containing protein [Chloroflexi bacterium]|nr:carboxypeptidase regulatory-like domain-containing protein [Chloroflexota bacterium]
MHVLANTPAASPARTFHPYLGDYLYMMAVGSSFHGIFSANNTPDTGNFPSGIAYQRNANFATHTLLNVDDATPVPISIDPFFFTVTDLPANVITGLVTDTSAQPMVDATILVDGPGGGTSVQLSTDSSGRYTTPILAPGAYDVSAVLSGFVPTSAAVTVLDTVLLTVQNFILQRTLLFTVGGLVADATGVPIAGATLRLSENSASPGIWTTQTDAMGRYSFSNEDPGPFAGQYTEEVRAAGFVSDSRDFAVPNGATITQNFQLVKQGVLTGHVSDARGAPLGGASVSLDSAQTFTDATGLYSILLDPGQYTETVALVGFRTSVASVTISDGATLVHDFTLASVVPGSITGTVTDDSGSPLHATVTIAGASTRTDVDGSFTLANVDPGTYTATASAGPHYTSDTETVTVTEGQAAVVNFILTLKSPIF